MAAHDDYYTEQRLKDLLAVYDSLGYPRPPRDPELAGRVRRALGEAPWAEAAARAADIQRGLRWLHERDWRAAFAIRAICIVGLTVSEATSYLHRHGAQVSRTTVFRLKEDGLTNMAAYLNGKMA